MKYRIYKQWDEWWLEFEGWPPIRMNTKAAAEEIVRLRGELAKALEVVLEVKCEGLTSKAAEG